MIPNNSEQQCAFLGVGSASLQGEGADFTKTAPAICREHPPRRFETYMTGLTAQCCATVRMNWWKGGNGWSRTSGRFSAFYARFSKPI
jgi:hypothetical protein